MPKRLLLSTPATKGEVRGLCVRRTWMDDQDNQQYGPCQWRGRVPIRWNDTEVTPDPRCEWAQGFQKSDTKAIDWYVDLDSGFDYEVGRFRPSVDDDASELSCSSVSGIKKLEGTGKLAAPAAQSGGLHPVRRVRASEERFRRIRLDATGDLLDVAREGTDAEVFHAGRFAASNTGVPEGSDPTWCVTPHQHLDDGHHCGCASSGRSVVARPFRRPPATTKPRSLDGRNGRNATSVGPGLRRHNSTLPRSRYAVAESTIGAGISDTGSEFENGWFEFGRPVWQR